MEQIVFFYRYDLLSILVKVNEEVGRANARLEGGVYKQIPAPLVTLRKKLFFRWSVPILQKTLFFYCVCEINVMYIDEHQLHFSALHMARFTCMLKLIHVRVPYSAIFLVTNWFRMFARTPLYQVFMIKFCIHQDFFEHMVDSLKIFCIRNRFNWCQSLLCVHGFTTRLYFTSYWCVGWPSSVNVDICLRVLLPSGDTTVYKATQSILPTIRYKYISPRRIWICFELCRDQSYLFIFIYIFLVLIHIFLIN